MHRYKTIVQTLLVLSTLNLVYAVPVVPQEVRDTSNDVGVVAEDVITGSDRRRGIPPGGTTGTTSSQYSSSFPDGSPPHDSLPLDEPALLQGSEPASGPAPSSHLSATDGQVPVHESTTEASTFEIEHPLSAAAHGQAPVPDSNTEASTSSQRPVPVHDSTAEGSTTPHYTAITPDMLHRDPHETSTARNIAGYTMVAGVVTAIVLLSVFYHNHNNNTGG
jgi:hypothetical protein